MANRVSSSRILLDKSVNQYPIRGFTQTYPVEYIVLPFGFGYLHCRPLRAQYSHGYPSEHFTFLDLQVVHLVRVDEFGSDSGQKGGLTQMAT